MHAFRFSHTSRTCNCPEFTSAVPNVPTMRTRCFMSVWLCRHSYLTRRALTRYRFGQRLQK